MLDQAHELHVVIGGSEDLPSIIPASDDVTESSSNFDPRLPRHGGADATVETD